MVLSVHPFGGCKIRRSKQWQFAMEIENVSFISNVSEVKIYKLFSN